MATTQKVDTKKLSDRSRKNDDKKPKVEKNRRGRSAAPTTLHPGQADPNGKVRHWILQQSDFMPKGEK